MRKRKRKKGSSHTFYHFEFFDSCLRQTSLPPEQPRPARKSRPGRTPETSRQSTPWRCSLRSLIQSPSRRRRESRHPLGFAPITPKAQQVSRSLLDPPERYRRRRYATSALIRPQSQDRVGDPPEGGSSSHRTVRTGPYTAPHARRIHPSTPNQCGSFRSERVACPTTAMNQSLG